LKKRAYIGLALVLGLILAPGFGALAQVLSGAWTTTITLESPPVALGLDAEVAVNYSLGTWTFTSDTGLDETGWARQSFGAVGTFGPLAISSRISFAPATPASLFTQWTATGTLSLAALTITGTFALTPGNVQIILDANASIGLATVRGTVQLGDTSPAGSCDFGWQGLDVVVDFPISCSTIKSTFAVTCDGFDELTFEAYRIALPAFPWVTLDALLTFRVDEKALVITPRFDFGMPVCFTVYTGISNPAGGLLPDIAIDGLGLSCTVGGLQFTGQSYWGTGSKPSLLSGTPYWEAYRIASSQDGCCGPFRFDVTVYFDHGDLLFDLAAIAGNVSVDLGESLDVSAGTEFDLAAATTTWTLEMVVAW